MKKIMKVSLVCLLATILIGCKATQEPDTTPNTSQTPTAEPTTKDSTSTKTESVVTLDPDGGTSEEKQTTIKYDSTFSLPVPKKEGYRFKGWYDGVTRITGTDGKGLTTWSLKDDVSLKAKYIDKITLSFYFEDQLIKKKPYSFKEDLLSAFEDDFDSLPFDSFWGWYKDDSLEDYVKTIDDFIIDNNDNANIYAREADDVTIENGILVKVKPSFDTPEDLDLNNLFFKGKRITGIDENVFYGKTDLKTVIIPNSVTSIGNLAFYNCKSLTSITLSKGLTSIGKSAFSSCNALTSISIPESVTSIGDDAFSACWALTSINIPEGVTSIGKETFNGCSSLTSMTIPDSVTSIGENAFYHCTALTSINIPNNVTSIGVMAFNGCSSLTSIIIPNSVTSIGDYAFEDCSSLTINCEAKSKPSGWSSSWNNDDRPVNWEYKG